MKKKLQSISGFDRLRLQTRFAEAKKYADKMCEAREAVVRAAISWQRTKGIMAPELWKAVDALLKLEKGKQNGN